MKNIKMILFDIDNTLVFGDKATQLYRQYSTTLENKLAQLLNIEFKVAKQIADEHRANYDGRGELAFETHGLNLTHWYDTLIKLNPSQYLEPLPQTQAILDYLQSQKYIIGAITDGPEGLIEKIFNASNIKKTSFDFIIGWQRANQMPKYGSSAIFEQVCDARNILREEAVMIGDSLGSDIEPARRAGLKTLHIGHDIPDITYLSKLL